MLSRLLWRPARPARPKSVYYLLGGGTSSLLALAFTLSQVYYVTVVGLSPLQMVLVGTVLEATCFLFEIPTGIVADLYSRRLSVVIGVTLLGAGMLLQGLVPTFAAVLVAQVVWGTGSTFLSGADEAWLADEIGEDAVAPVFTRETQLSLALTLVAPLAAGGLGLIGLGVPVAASGLGLSRYASRPSKSAAVPYVATLRHGRVFSAAISPAMNAIHAMLMTPSAKSDAMSAQQQPTHQAPCIAPIRKDPDRPSRHDPSRKPSGLRHFPRQTSLSGVSS